MSALLQAGGALLFLLPGGGFSPPQYDLCRDVVAGVLLGCCCFREVGRRGRLLLWLVPWWIFLSGMLQQSRFELAKNAMQWQYTPMGFRFRIVAVFALVFAAVMLGCQGQGSNSYLRTPRAVKFKPVPGPILPRTMTQMAREINIRTRIIPSNSLQRSRAKRMRPTFITIHSTANHSASSTAMQHSLALCNGAFTNRSWHFTVDQFMVVQNLPVNETAWHAGSQAGNHHSIGIEMCECENRGANHFRTWDRAAKLTAVLMKRFNINLRRVVPHYHWTGKNCPAPLMTNGRPGAKWAWYLSRVDYYFRCLNNGVSRR